jgi:NTE family protein
VRVVQDSLTRKRETFRAAFSPITIDHINTTGIDYKKEQYIRKSINPKNDCMDIADLKPAYFRLLSDDNIKTAFPTLRFNDTTGFYDLNLLIKKENDLRIDFGGNISSSPINEGYVGLQYNLLGKSSLIMNGNIYFGKLYNSAELRVRYDIRGKVDFYLEPVATWNRFDYYKSSSAFFEGQVPWNQRRHTCKEQRKGICFGRRFRHDQQVLSDS